MPAENYRNQGDENGALNHAMNKQHTVLLKRKMDGWNRRKETYVFEHDCALGAYFRSGIIERVWCIQFPRRGFYIVDVLPEILTWAHYFL